MNKATKRGTRMLTGMAAVHGHQMSKYRHHWTTVKGRLAHAKCRNQCGAEGMLHTRTDKGKSRITGVGGHGIREECQV